ncbi:headcase protein [Biomphalaria pfeifferi]|uniref:Headcase protein n=1 Tax=Biomphalaria pfeifferi TaxID=112525 RepID=A0AAD8EYZ0_BIOPF|nr:headcase protein [Biomphalaria pfeifferi]
MPNIKHHKGHRNGQDEVQQNQIGNQLVVNNPRMEHQHHQDNENGVRLQNCCVPTGCSDDPIDPSDPCDAVKVVCNNDACTLGNWMHKNCFIEWEKSVLSFLRSCGRARSWSEKQRLQNLWTKKGYDLAYKACDCKCGRGHLRKDLDYIPAPYNENAKKVRKNKKKNDKPMPVVSTNHKSAHNNNHMQQPHAVDNHQHLAPQPSLPVDNATKILRRDSVTDNSRRRGSDNTINNNPSNVGKERCRNNSINNPGHDLEILDNSAHHVNMTFSSHPLILPNSALRMRTNSVSSTGSVGSQASSSGSIPSSAGSISPLSSSPVNGNVFFKGKKGEAYDPNQTSMFRRRQDLSAFNALPRCKRNPYNIHIEDVQEDEDTRNFVLSNLTTKRMTALRCVLCKSQLPVFDRFPLVDGTLFLSPQAYDQHVVQVIWEGRIQFLNAVCIGCLEGACEAKCSSCKTPWDGTSFVVGTMYTYDIFAAMPCCQKRLTCKHCRRAVIDVSVGLDFYSQYSRMIICPYCKANDYHFIRSLTDTFTMKDSI